MSDSTEHASALIAYEYAITLDLEVNLFWKRRVTMTSILFAANRYLPLIVVMLNAPYPTQLITLMVRGRASLIIDVSRLMSLYRGESFSTYSHCPLTP